MISFSKKMAAVFLLLAVAACSSPEQRLEKYTEEGAEFLEQGDLGRANVQFQNALKINEEHIPALKGLSEIAEQRQDFRALYGVLQRIVRIDPNQIDSQVKLGQLYLIGSDETAALEQAEAVLLLEPGNQDAQTLKAAVKLKVGDYVSAVEIAEGVVAENPTHPEAVTVLATERSLQNDNPGALAVLDRALEQDDSIVVLQLLRIQLLKELDQGTKVRDAYLRLINNDPEEEAFRGAFAEYLLTQGDYPATLEQLEAIVALKPNQTDSKLDVVRVLRMLEGDEVAEAKLKEYVEQNEDNEDLRFAYVDFLVDSNEIEKAKAALSPALSSDDQDVQLEARNKVVTLYLANEERDAAIAEIDAILKIDAENTEALVKKSGLQIEDEEYEIAILNLRTVLNSDPDNSRAMLLMATAFERQGNLNLAQAELAKAFDESNKDADVANFYARYLIRNDKVARAEEVLLEALGRAPGHIDNLKLLAAARLSLQDWEGAEEVAAILEETDEEADVISNIRSIAATGLEDYNSVIENLSSRRARAPLESRPLATLVVAYMRTDRVDEALTLLNNVIESDPNNYEAHIYLAQVYGSRQEPEKAEEALLNATNLDATRSEAFELLYRYYMRNGEREKATRLLEGGLERAPDNTALRVFRADAMIAEGQLENALTVYEELYQQRPDDLIVANNFASLTNMLRSDDASNAAALEAASKLAEADNPLFKDTQGWANFKAGNVDLAVELLEQAASQVGENAEILYHLGAAQHANGDTEAARETLTKALSISGDDFQYRSEIEDLLAQ